VLKLGHWFVLGHDGDETRLLEEKRGLRSRGRIVRVDFEPYLPTSCF
jgi:hypothetical protein